MLRPRPGPDGRPSLTQSSSAAALDVPKFVPKVDLQADYSTAKVRGRPPAGREEGSCRGQGAGRHPAPLCVSGHLGCRLPGPAAGTDSARGAGADRSGAALVRVSALRAGWVGRRGSPGPLQHRPGAGPSVPEGGGSDRAPFGREMLQATCRRTLELARMALLFLSSSLGPERWVSSRDGAAAGVGPAPPLCVFLSRAFQQCPLPPPVQSCRPPWQAERRGHAPHRQLAALTSPAFQSLWAVGL